MKLENKDEQKIRFILESRLRLQSIQRYLDGYNIRQRSFDYLKSGEFVKNHFVKWGTFQQKQFLIKMVGAAYWEKFQKMLEG